MGADGSGDQASKTFAMLGTNLVIAECGNAVTGLVQVISSYTIIPSSRFICLSNTVTAEAWTVDENGVAVKTNSDWTIPAGAGRVAFVDGVTHTNAMTSVSVVKIIGTNVSAVLDDIQIHAHATGAESLADDEWFTVIKVDLSAIDLDGVAADATEETIGAYVHWNLDNDDASDNTLGASKRPGADYLQIEATKVTGENDLKSLAMSLQPDLNHGSVVLNIVNAKAKVWKDAEKGSTNLVLAGPGDKTWNLADAGQKAGFVSLSSNLWVEGVDGGICDIKLSYNDTSGAEICSDKVKYTFIAADCGRQPKTDPSNERNDVKITFPHLIHCEWSITAEATPIGRPDVVYNCIAWSAGISDRWINPVIIIGGVSVPDHWDNGVHYVGIDAKYGNGNGEFEIQADLDAFYAAEASVTPTATGPGDASVIYYDGYHASKKKSCTCGSGKWIMFESKCGAWLRIEHVYDQLDGCDYGVRIRYYK